MTVWLISAHCARSKFFSLLFFLFILDLNNPAKDGYQFRLDGADFRFPKIEIVRVAAKRHVSRQPEIYRIQELYEQSHQILAMSRDSDFENIFGETNFEPRKALLMSRFRAGEYRGR